MILVIRNLFPINLIFFKSKKNLLEHIFDLNQKGCKYILQVARLSFWFEEVVVLSLGEY